MSSLLNPETGPHQNEHVPFCEGVEYVIFHRRAFATIPKSVGIDFSRVREIAARDEAGGRVEPPSEDQIEQYLTSCFWIHMLRSFSQKLDEANIHAEKWVQLIPRHDPDYGRRAGIRDFLTWHETSRMQALELISDVDKRSSAAVANSIQRITDALRDVSFARVDKAHVMYQQAYLLCERYRQLGSSREQVQARQNCIAILSLREDPFLFDVQLACVGILQYLFNDTKKRYIIDEAISAAEYIAQDYKKLGLQITRLYYFTAVRGYQTRYSSFNNSHDLQLAAELHHDAEREGISLPEILTPFMYLSLCNLSRTRFSRTNSDEALHDAIFYAERCLDIIPRADHNRTAAIHSYMVLVSTMLRKDLSIDNISRINNSISQVLQEVPSESHTDSVKATLLATLVSSLMDIFLLYGNVDSVDEAVRAGNEAVRLAPEDTYCSFMLAYALSARYATVEDDAEQDRIFEDAIRRFDGASSNSMEPANRRIEALHRSAQLLISRSEWKQASHRLQAAIEVLPEVSRQTVEHTDKQWPIKSSGAGLACLASAATLNATESPDVALELLEKGRGLIAETLLETRKIPPNITGLDNHTIIKLRSCIEIIDSAVSPEQHFQADSSFQEVLRDIRQTPGFEDFLRPPTSQIMMDASASGPIVVINVSELRCDAFLVMEQDIRLLELPLLEMQDLKDRINDLTDRPWFLESTLEWLWVTTASPILTALGCCSPYTDLNDCPHVWWIPTGLLSRLPLHAAGRYDGEDPECVLDRVVSSYSSSIKTLMLSRKCLDSPLKQQKPSQGKALVVSMGTTPWTPDLKPCNLIFAEHEAKHIQDHLGGIEHIYLERPYKAQVLEALKGCSIFHFAGHGMTKNEDPSASSLLLQDWADDPLTVADLWRLNLQDEAPQLAYLSACSTGQNLDPGLQDESITLMNACQLAGIPHIIGTLWTVDDAICAHAARNVYKALGEQGWSLNKSKSVAIAVHKATQELRSLTSFEDPSYARRLAGDPFYWATFIHLGP